MGYKLYYWLVFVLTFLMTITNAADIYRFIEQNSFICQLSEETGSAFLTQSEAAQKGCTELCGRVESTGEACAKNELRKNVHCAKVPILCMRDFSVQYSGAHILKRIAEARARASAAKNAEKEGIIKEKKKTEKRKSDKIKQDIKKESSHPQKNTSNTKNKSPKKRSSASHVKRQSTIGRAVVRQSRHHSEKRRLKDGVIDEVSEEHQIAADSARHNDRAKAGVARSPSTRSKPLITARRLHVRSSDSADKFV
ncbi:hypothetical protein Tcan_13367 [Toxocara canis]|uniref:Uncharacterized protein n=1 Tax=Toxocara canis TaxID=6265 RepID=A0A0B2V8Z8_TOXCA|nr:hypothetical protein Tcan_13367 [Toxocara canis]